jgi:hypothetical protein
VLPPHRKSLATPTNRCCLLLQVRVQLLPEEQRPDFSAMLGGVQLQQVFLTLRSKTDRLVLKDASMTLTGGHAAIITSKEGCHQTCPC